MLNPQPKQYAILLTEDDLNVIGHGLGKVAMEIALPVHQKIGQQFFAQKQEETPPPQEPPASP